MTLSMSNAAAIAACDSVVDLADIGTTDAQASVSIYSGTPPANTDTALSGNTVLAELEMANPAFGAAVDAAPGGRAAAGAITDDTAADATGTATFFRIFDRDNVALIQGSVTVTAGGGDMEINSIAIQIGSKVEITSLTVTIPEA